MREINEAWTTLRNPGARAAYDAKLAGDVEQSVPSLAGVGQRYEFSSRSVHPGGSAWFADEPEVADIEPIDETADETTTKMGFQAWHLGPLAIGAVMLIVVLVLLVRTNNYDDRPNIVQTRERYGTGVCVLVSKDAAGQQQVAEVPCAGANSGRVVTKVDFPRPCPLQTTNVVLEAEQISLCLSR